MRAILVAATVMVAMAAPAFAGGISDDDELRKLRDARAQEETTTTAPEPAASREVVVEEYHSAGAEFGLGIASTFLSILYAPPRAVLGLVGAHMGGVGGWATGGDIRTGKALWRPTVEGHYFIRPDHLDGSERFRPINTAPVFHGRYTVHERVETTDDEAAMTDDTIDEDLDDMDDLDDEELDAQRTDARDVEERAEQLNSPVEDLPDDDRL